MIKVNIIKVHVLELLTILAGFPVAIATCYYYNSYSR